MPYGGAAIYHVDGTLALTGLVAAANKFQGRRTSTTADVVEVIDGQNQVCGKDYSMHRQTATFTVVPVDPTDPQSVAGAKAALERLAIGSLVTIANADIGASGTKWMDGTWNLDSWDTEEAPGQPLRLTLNCSRVGNPPAALAATS